jgi:hypothetical protein
MQRLQLAAYDEEGSGMLDVQQLQRYLAAAVASAPLLACIEVRHCSLLLLLGFQLVWHAGRFQC